MKSQILTYIAATCLFSALAFRSRRTRSTEERPAAEYYVFNLGAPGGGTIAMAASINDIGWVAGDAYQTGNTTDTPNSGSDLLSTLGLSADRTAPWLGRIKTSKERLRVSPKPEKPIR